MHNSDTDELELWLGEAKFYKSVTKAINAALRDLEEHFETDYLKTEFALICDKLDADHPHAEQLLTLLDPNATLDDVFDRVVVPVLVTYDTKAVIAHERDCETYREELEAEARRAWLQLSNGLDSTLPVQVKLLLVPLGTKEALLDALADELAT